jgi:hypothetical protein
MDIHAGNGVIEIGYIWFAPALQRTRAATEAMVLMLDYAMTKLRYRRMQWRCNAMNAKSRSAASRLSLRRHLLQSPDLQGPEPRHSLVFNSRRRMAGREGAS